MVMAFQPTAAEVQNLAPGAVFAGGSDVVPGGYGAGSWNSMIDSYVAAAGRSRLAVPILYGVDAVHGNNKVTGAVIFPHNAGLGCTRNPSLVEEVGRVTAREASATGMTWTFAPVVSVVVRRSLGPCLRKLQRRSDPHRTVERRRHHGSAGARGPRHREAGNRRLRETLRGRRSSDGGHVDQGRHRRSRRHPHRRGDDAQASASLLICRRSRRASDRSWSATRAGMAPASPPAGAS